MIVPLTDPDLLRIKRFADLRNNKGGSRRESGRHSDWQIHYAGLKLEAAMEKVTGSPIDERFLPHGDHHRPDLYIGGKSIEVKSAMYDPPIIKFNLLKHLRSDIIVIGLPREREVEIYGGISRAKFLRCFHMRDFGYGKRFCVDPSFLTQFEVILDYLLRRGK